MTRDKDHLQWMLNRLAEVHGENRNVDYMIRMQKIIDNTETELNLHLVSKTLTDLKKLLAEMTIELITTEQECRERHQLIRNIETAKESINALK